MKRIAATLFALSLTAVSASAATIHQRYVSQQDRIAGGIATGQLSPREAARIESQEVRLGAEIRAFRVGGISPQERAIVEHQQNRLSREIYAQKHDRNRW